MRAALNLSRPGSTIVWHWRSQRLIVSLYGLIDRSYQSVETVLQIEALGDVPGGIL
jgi:hypothetical protein